AFPRVPPAAPETARRSTTSVASIGHSHANESARLDSPSRTTGIAAGTAEAAGRRRASRDRQGRQGRGAGRPPRARSRPGDGPARQAGGPRVRAPIPRQDAAVRGARVRALRAEVFRSAALVGARSLALGLAERGPRGAGVEGAPRSARAGAGGEVDAALARLL